VTAKKTKKAKNAVVQATEEAFARDCEWLAHHLTMKAVAPLQRGSIVRCQVYWEE
jgi:hypothetical protein